MSTIIIALLIAVAAVLGIRQYIKQKGSCGDCSCACPVKEEMKQMIPTLRGQLNEVTSGLDELNGLLKKITRS